MSWRRHPPRGIQFYTVRNKIFYHFADRVRFHRFGCSLRDIHHLSHFISRVSFTIYLTHTHTRTHTSMHVHTHAVTHARTQTRARALTSYGSSSSRLKKLLCFVANRRPGLGSSRHVPLLIVPLPLCENRRVAQAKSHTVTAYQKGGNIY